MKAPQSWQEQLKSQRQWRVKPLTLAIRLAEVPDRDDRDITGRQFGDPNPADMRRHF